MAAFSIETFRTALNGGAHANLFEVAITLPTGPSTTDLTGITSNFATLCKAAAVPAMTLGIIEVPFRGRRAKIPGDRTFGEWTATFINDSGQKLREGFENWMKYMADGNFGSTLTTISGVTAAGSAATIAKTADNYKGIVSIKQLNDAGTAMRTYSLQNAFCSDISAIDLSYDTVDSIEEFTVTFQYSHFTMA
jgi:hypothetical protein